MTGVKLCNYKEKLFFSENWSYKIEACWKNTKSTCKENSQGRKPTICSPNRWHPFHISLSPFFFHNLFLINHAPFNLPGDGSQRPSEHLSGRVPLLARLIKKTTKVKKVFWQWRRRRRRRHYDYTVAVFLCISAYCQDDGPGGERSNATALPPMLLLSPPPPRRRRRTRVGRRIDSNAREDPRRWQQNKDGSFIQRVKACLIQKLVLSDRDKVSIYCGRTRENNRGWWWWWWWWWEVALG